MADPSELVLVRGMSWLANAQAAIAHNLANVDTNGFKRRTYVAASEGAFEQVLQGQMPSVRFEERTDWRRGVARETSNRFNLALEAPYLMRVRDDAGRVYYTRDGEMRLDESGRLVTHSGLRYLDAHGAEIVLLDGDHAPSDVAIAPNGAITDPAGGKTWGPIGIWQLPDRSALQPVGDGLYVDARKQKPLPAGPRAVQQGFLEGSNVDSLQELVQMILVQRTFAATQRALTGVGRMHESLIDNMLR